MREAMINLVRMIFLLIFTRRFHGLHQCSNYRVDRGISPTAVVDPHVIHGVEVSAPQCRPRPSTAFS